ncbi:MAG: hypothetical protein ABSF54_15110, partial [Bryobacteraceae bacterium]
SSITLGNMLPPNLSLWGKLASGWLVEQSRERPFTQKFGHIPAGFHPLLAFDDKILRSASVLMIGQMIAPSAR